MPRPRTGRKFLLYGFTTVALLALVFVWRLQRGQARWDGSARIAGLSGQAAVLRDELGTPTLEAKTALDAARALGFAHAQDRFFQMDLWRRRATGETAELLGKRGVEADKLARSLDLRTVAQNTLAGLPNAEQDLARAYAEGVNAGLAALPGRPAEYLLAGRKPRAWEAEDCILVMNTWVLLYQEAVWTSELQLAQIRDGVGSALADVLSPLPGQPNPPLPGPAVINLTRRTNEDVSEGEWQREIEERAAALLEKDAPPALWSGRLSLTSAHDQLVQELEGPLNYPAPWYPATLRTADNEVSGLTLPGSPLVWMGSNGRVAWSINPLAPDASDLVVLIPSDIEPESLYVRGTQILEFERRSHTVHVRSDDDVTFESLHTVWGPVVARGEKRRHLALESTVLSPGALSLGWHQLATADSAEAAANLAANAPSPHFEFVAVDLEGNAATAQTGMLPVRRGYDGRYPVTFTFGDRGWQELRPVVDTGVTLQTGSSGQWQGKSDDPGAYLFASVRSQTTTAAPETSLVPGSAREGWASLLAEAVARNAKADKIRRADEAGRGGAAFQGWLEQFRRQATARVLASVLGRTLTRYSDFTYNCLPASDGALRIIREAQPHLLDPGYGSWDELVDEALRDTLANPPSQKSVPFRPLVSLGFPNWVTWPFRLDGRDHPDRPPSASRDEVLHAVFKPSLQTPPRFSMPGGVGGSLLGRARKTYHDFWLGGETIPVAAPSHRLELKP